MPCPNRADLRLYEMKASRDDGTSVWMQVSEWV